MAIMLSLSFIGSLTLTQASVTANTAERKLPIYCVETDEKKIAVTFDAAWSAEDTDKLLEILKKHDAKATIFVVGDWVRANPDAVKKFHQAGHEIGNHSDTHTAFSKADREKIKEEIENCNAEIEKITGFKPKILRAPSGDYDNKSIEVTESLGIKMIQWDVDIIDIKVMTNVYLYAIMNIV